MSLAKKMATVALVSGLTLSVAACHHGNGPKVKNERHGCGSKNGCKGKSGCKGKNSCKGNSCKNKHSCKGNSCKGK